MSIIVEVQFAHARGALAHTLEERPDTDVKLIRETSTEPAQTAYFLRFDADRHDDLEAVLEADPTVATVVSVPDEETGELWRVEFAEAAELLDPLVTSEDGVVLQARSATAADGDRVWHEYWFLPDREAVRSIWQHARDAGFDFEILQFRRQTGPLSDRTLTEALTEEQLTALTLAYESGYFTEPRETNLAELGEQLDLSPSAVAGRLKRGLRVLIEAALVDRERA